MPAEIFGAPTGNGSSALREILGLKWGLEILHVLAGGPRRRIDIWPAVQQVGISHGRRPGNEAADPLDRALGRLVGAGLLVRTEEPDVFPRRVVYEVAAEAEILVGLLVRLTSLAQKLDATRRTSRHQPYGQSA